MRALARRPSAGRVRGRAAPPPRLDTPKSGPSDPRIKVIDYDPWAVVNLTGVFRTATQIQFGDEETILHVALGDTTGWEVAAEKNILFVKPKAPGGPTNLIVTTSRGGRPATLCLRTHHPRAGASARNTPDMSSSVCASAIRRTRRPRPPRSLSADAAALDRRIVDLKLDRAVARGPAQPGLRRAGRRRPAALGGLRQRPLHRPAVPGQPACADALPGRSRRDRKPDPLRRARRIRGGPRRRPPATPAARARRALHLQRGLRALRPQPRHRHRRAGCPTHRQGSPAPMTDRRSPTGGEADAPPEPADRVERAISADRRAAGVGPWPARPSSWPPSWPAAASSSPPPGTAAGPAPRPRRTNRRPRVVPALSRLKVPAARPWPRRAQRPAG